MTIDRIADELSEWYAKHDLIPKVTISEDKIEKIVEKTAKFFAEIIREAEPQTINDIVTIISNMFATILELSPLTYQEAFGLLETVKATLKDHAYEFAKMQRVAALLQSGRVVIL